MIKQQQIVSTQFRDLAYLTGGGSVAFCGSNNQCHIANNHKSWFANEIVKGHDGLYYVVQSAGGKIFVYSLEDNFLLKIDEINVGTGLDNLSVDTKGNIFAAGFPKVLSLVKALNEPLSTEVPSTIFKVTKALEDIDGRVLPGSTVAVHDVKTDTFFMGGVTSPFITVCARQSSMDGEGRRQISRQFKIPLSKSYPGGPCTRLQTLRSHLPHPGLYQCSAYGNGRQKRRDWPDPCSHIIRQSTREADKAGMHMYTTSPCTNKQD
jgi:hypothetical protein